MNGRKSIAACCALRIFDAATICMAFVIWAVLLMERMRRRSSRVLAIDHAQLWANLSAVAFNSAVRASLSAFWAAIFASRSVFDVVRCSVNRA